MAIEELVAAVPPPNCPVNTDDRWRWEALQAELGTALPVDWLTFALRYGSGLFYPTALWVSNPLHESAGVETKSHLALFHENVELGCLYPFAIHPAVPGFLPWGSSDLGHSYGWLTDGQPDRWPVVFVGHEQEDKLVRLDESMTTFLARMFRAEYPDVCRPVPSIAHRFIPGRDQNEAYRNV